MIISTLFAALGLLTGGQNVHDIPLQEIQQTASFTRYKFDYRNNIHIVDLNQENKIAAYYINNSLQNELFVHTDEYDEHSKNDLMHQFFLSDTNILEYADEHIDTGTRTLTGRRGGDLGMSQVYEYEQRQARKEEQRSILIPTLHREYNSDRSEYYSHDGRCFQRGGRRKTYWWFWKKYTEFVRNGSITELNPTSSNCPTNRRYVLQFRADPLSFFGLDNRYVANYVALDSTNRNFVWRNITTFWYFTDDYLLSGEWLTDVDLAYLFIKNGLLQVLTQDVIDGFFNEIAQAENSIKIANIINVGLEVAEIAASLVSLVPSGGTSSVLIAAKFAKNAHSLIKNVRKVKAAFEQIVAHYSTGMGKKLSKPSRWGQGWIVTKTSVLWNDLHISYAPRVW